MKVSGDRDWTDALTSQGIARIACSHQEVRQAWNWVCRRNQHCQILFWISVFQKYEKITFSWFKPFRFVVIFYGSPRKLKQVGNYFRSHVVEWS